MNNYPFYSIWDDDAGDWFAGIRSTTETKSFVSARMLADTIQKTYPSNSFTVIEIWSDGYNAPEDRIAYSTKESHDNQL